MLVQFGDETNVTLLTILVFFFFLSQCLSINLLVICKAKATQAVCV